MERLKLSIDSEVEEFAKQRESLTDQEIEQEDLKVLSGYLDMAITSLIDSMEYLYIAEKSVNGIHSVYKQSLPYLRMMRRAYEVNYKRITKSKAIYSENTCLYIIEKLNSAIVAAHSASVVQMQNKEIKNQSLIDLHSEIKSWQRDLQLSRGIGGSFKLYDFKEIKG